MFQRKSLFVKVYYFTYITLSWKHTYKQTFTIACSIIVNELDWFEYFPRWIKEDSIFALPFLGSASLSWILPSEYFSTDSKQYSTG